MDRELLLEVMQMNWQHARHIETQRIALNLAYVGAMGASIAYALGKETKPIPMLIIAAAALFLTLLCWGMTRKWNLAFQNQIIKADKCAKLLLVGISPDGETQLTKLHSFVGFPVTDPRFPWLNVRRMFAALYIGSALTWVALLGYVLFCKGASAT